MSPYWNSLGIFLGILWEFYGNSLGFFGNSLGILWEFSGNSLEILWEFYRNVLGMCGWVVLNVWVLILGDKEVRFDLMTDNKTITRSGELECSRLKMTESYKQQYFDVEFLFKSSYKY